LLFGHPLAGSISPAAVRPPIRQGRISRPTLVLWGGAEEVLPAEQLDTLRAAIDEVTVRTYEGTGHLVLWEQPERVAADVTAFIDVSATSVSPPSA
jgi:rifampin ADP-ribosylating transferase